VAAKADIREGITPAVGLKPSALRCQARLRGLGEAAQVAFVAGAEAFTPTASVVQLLYKVPICRIR